MENNFETIVNALLEKLAQGYANAKAEWQADRRNPFKDGRFLGYYEAKEALLKHLNAEETLNNALEELVVLYNRAKAEWKADKKNLFKDGKFLACFEILNMIPAAA